MRLSLAGLAAALVCASACGGVVTAAGPSDARGGAGGSDGSGNGAYGATGGAILGGAGTIGVSITGATGIGGGQGGEPGCGTRAAACECDSQAAKCQPVLMTACLGQHCPPGLDDAMRVANWTLASASESTIGRPHASYSSCEGGARIFSFDQHGLSYGFGFDGNGRLAAWSTWDHVSCSQLVCGGSETLDTFSCFVCQMYSDPQPEGTDLIPRGIRHGPVPSCEVDANGRWTQPHLAPAN